MPYAPEPAAGQLWRCAGRSPDEAPQLLINRVDQHPKVMAELETWSSRAQAGAATNDDLPTADPDYTPAEG